MSNLRPHPSLRENEVLVGARLSELIYDEQGRVKRNEVRLAPDEFAIGLDGTRYSGDRTSAWPGTYQVGAQNPQAVVIVVRRVEPEFFVQVQVSGASPTYPWTYRDPSGELEVGDRILVPFGYDDAERVAKVVALGKGDNVPAYVRIKDVAARLEVEELA